MDFMTAFAPLLALSLLVERVLEVAGNVQKILAKKPAEGSAPADTTSKTIWESPEWKQIWTLVFGIVFGIILAYLLGVGFFGKFTTLDASIDKLITGAVAGAIAPYAHQIIEALLNLQKFLEAQKELVRKEVEKK